MKYTIKLINYENDNINVAKLIDNETGKELDKRIVDRKDNDETIESKVWSLLAKVVFSENKFQEVVDLLDVKIEDPVIVNY